jgi:hypothetical protein
MKKYLQKPYKNGYIKVCVSVENNQFSVTGSIYEPFEEGCHREIDSWEYFGGKYAYAYGGSIQDDILKAYPILKPIVDLHLCDHYGTPWACLDNAFYHYECGNKEAFRDHLMIDNFWTDLLFERLDREPKGKQHRKLLLANRIYESLANLWEDKAIKAMEVYNNLIDYSVYIENDLYEHSAE